MPKTLPWSGRLKLSVNDSPDPEITILPPITENPLDRILIFRPSPFGRMYLCADGTTSSDKSEAAEFWRMQFDQVVRENWIVNTPERAEMEEITK
jgi:hypothetical protein